MLAALKDYGDNYVAFMLEQSRQTRAALITQPPAPELRQRFAQLAAQSRQSQHQIEVSDTVDFETYRREYTSAARLGL